MASSSREIRVAIRHPGLLRAGTNFLLAALLLAAFYAADASNTNWGTWHISAAKYAPIILAAASTVCFLLGLRRAPVSKPMMLLIGFAAVSLAGGFYTLFTHRASLMDTFIGRGLCVVVLVPSYLACLLPEQRRHLTRGVFWIVTIVSLCMIPVLLAWQLGYRFLNQNHIYHISAVYFCSAAAFAMGSGRTVVRRSAVLLFALACVLTFKLTGFGFAAIIAGLEWRLATARGKRENDDRLARRRLLAALCLIGVVSAAAGTALRYWDHLPDGSREVRLQTYSARIEQFVDAPLWGSLFTGSPIMQVGLLIIPSHSDFLDILGFGGLLGVTLFYMPVLVCLAYGLRDLSTSDPRYDGMTVFAIVTVACCLWESAVNPILGDPRFITLYWIAAGALLAHYEVGKRRPIVLRSREADWRMNPLVNSPAALRRTAGSAQTSRFISFDDQHS